MSFRTQESKNKEIVFKLEQYGQDVDIFANGVLIATFSGSRERLELFVCYPSEIAKLPGLKFDEHGRVATEKWGRK